MPKLNLLWLVVALVVLVAPVPGHAVSEVPIVVIAHKDVKVAALSRDELRLIFQTKKNTWPDGSPVRPFNLPDTSLVRRVIDAAVLGLDSDRIARYWIDRKIRGGERAPQIAPSSGVMVKVVSKTAGAIGYVEATAADASVKVIAKIIGGQVVKP
jgi:ABC-type phosphate transport system substrate-binding protein